MASRPKTRARLQGALASRKDKRTSYPPPATHQEAPRNDFWGLFLAFRYKRASSSVNALRTALKPSESGLIARKTGAIMLLPKVAHRGNDRREAYLMQKFVEFDDGEQTED